MFTPKHLVVGSLFVLMLAGVALAQENRAPIEMPREPVASGPLVTAAATAERVRFVSPGTVVQLRLEVYNEAGQKLFDTELRGGNVLDWNLQDGTGQRLPTGSYACVLTTKSLSGRLSQRVGLVTVNDKEAAVRAAGAAELSTAQQQTIGPVEFNAAFTVVEESEAKTITAVTHDGTDSQVTATSGALSLRTGDLFSGKDVERMRITAEGNVGIGTDKPQARLDVSGTIRVEKGIEFADGTVQTSGLSGRKDKEGNLMPNVSGTGTTGRLTKWTNGPTGALGDSVVTEASGKLGIGTANPNYEITLLGNDVGLQLISSLTGVTANDGFRFGIDSTNKPFLWNAEATDMYFGTTATERMRIKATGNVGIGTTNATARLEVVGDTRVSSNLTVDTNTLFVNATNDRVGVGTISPAEKLDVVGNIKASGSLTGATGSVTGNFTVDTNTLHVDATSNRVGVGTTTPGAPLDVVGEINTSMQYNIGGSRVLSNAGVSNIFAGVGAGNSNTSGAGNSFFGNSAGFANTSGSSNSFIGSNAGGSNMVGGGNSFLGTDAGFANSAGHFNSFFGNQAGRNNTASNNSFFGQNAGFGNTTGTFNSFFGLAAGFANNEGFFNSFFGYRAGAANTGPTASANSFFGNLSGEANSAGNENSFFGASSGQMNTSGAGNSFFGTSAGFSNTTAGGNAFFGHQAGFANTTAGANSFFGGSAGKGTTTGANNSFFGSGAGQANTEGSGNSYFGSTAGSLNSVGINNSFFGFEAGFNNTAGANSFFGFSAGKANTSGNDNAFFGGFTGQANTLGNDNAFFGRSAGSSNTEGSNNSFFGASAGQSNTTSCCNSFFGVSAGFSNTEGTNNSFFGIQAGSANVSGDENSFFGRDAGAANTASNNSFFGSLAGFSNTEGTNNAFLGANAGESNTLGDGNSFFGQNAGADNISGSNNLFLGVGAGSLNVSGGNNVYLANAGLDEDNHIRIGTQGTQTATFIAGISGTTVAGDAVVVDANGQLGVAVSSRRFKQDIGAMGNASRRLMRLRPVVFHYRPEYLAGKPTLQYGLIAEEVARVYPELVGYGADGKPQSVRYHLLSTMLLNELQKQETHIQSQAQQLQNQAQQIADLEGRLRRLESQATVKRRRR